MNKKSEDVRLECDIGKREPVKSKSTKSSYFSTVILLLGPFTKVVA